MSKARVTVIMLHRDRFSLAEQAIAALYSQTEMPFELIYVDAGSPAEVQATLAAQANRYGFELIQRSEPLSPNQARNLALARVRTPLVVFLDNDCLVERGWLEALVACADETKAWMVGPLYLEDGLLGKRIHMAGGEAHFVEQQGRRHFQEVHYLFGQSLAAVGNHLRRQVTEMVEFHCMLLPMSALEALGPLDERYWSCRDAIDLCLRVRDAGQQVVIEPTARVTFLRPPPIAPIDRDFFWMRWSDAWNRASLDHFRDQWQLSADDPSYADHLKWLTEQRQLVLDPTLRMVAPLGRGFSRALTKYVLAPGELRRNRRAFKLAAV